MKNFELRGSDPKLGTVQKWRRALEVAGVRFIDADDQYGHGVRFSKETEAAAEAEAQAARANKTKGGPGVRLRGAKGKR